VKQALKFISKTQDYTVIQQQLVSGSPTLPDDSCVDTLRCV
jgi:hypothetical protein